MEITGELRRRLDAGDDLKDTAILLRTNQEAEGLVGALMERQVPFCPERNSAKSFSSLDMQKYDGIYETGSRAELQKEFSGDHEPSQPLSFTGGSGDFK